jgi:hypothetical protein
MVGFENLFPGKNSEQRVPDWERGHITLFPTSTLAVILVKIQNYLLELVLANLTVIGHSNMA